jgi:hypothetical protein
LPKQSKAISQLQDEVAYYRALAEGYEEAYSDTEVVASDWTLKNTGYDVISTPEHYVTHPSGIEPIDITAYETFLRGNVIKYVMRAPYKGKELEDLQKARQYLDWEIARVESGARP